MSLVAAALERRDIATVTLSVLPELSARLGAPRTLVVPFGLGMPAGPPLDAETQLSVVSRALELACAGGVPLLRTWRP